MDYLSKKNTIIPNTVVKIFDARTSDIISYPRKFDVNINSLTVMDDSNLSFLASNLDGDCFVYSLANGLVETHNFRVCYFIHIINIHIIIIIDNDNINDDDDDD